MYRLQPSKMQGLVVFEPGNSNRESGIVFNLAVKISLTSSFGREVVWSSDNPRRLWKEPRRVNTKHLVIPFIYLA